MSVTDKSDDELESTIDRATRSIESNRGEQRMAKAERKAAVSELVARREGEIEHLEQQADSLSGHAAVEKRNRVTEVAAEIEELEAEYLDD